MQKIANIVSESGAPSAPGIAPETLELVAPLAAMALMGYGGYALANKLSDKRAERERRQRVEENLNRLDKYNLERLALSRGLGKTAASELLGTMFNPFQGMAGIGGNVYVPKWFNVSGTGQPGQLEKLIAKTVLLGGTYGTMGFGLKYLMNALERKKEAQEGTKGIQSAVKAAMPMVNPDPYLSDLADEDKREAMGLEEEEAYDDLIEKTAKDEGPGRVQRAVGELRFGASDPQKTGLTDTARAMLLLAAVTTFGAGAVLTKKWADENDENRKRLKAAEKAARLRALQERPPTLVGDIDPDIKAQLDAHITGGNLRMRPRSVQLADTRRPELPASGTLEQQEMDPTDTLAQNIAVV